MGFLAIIAAALAMQSPANVKNYSENQVWEYRVRPGDEGSLLKIQRVEHLAAFEDSGPVYHISIIGFHLGGQSSQVLQHAPVSKETLDKSVIRLIDSNVEFPDPEAGIAEWRNAQGGVFTVSVAEIIDILDATLPENSP